MAFPTPIVPAYLRRRCPEGFYRQRAVCYVTFSSTYRGFDSFEYVAVDVHDAVSEPDIINNEILQGTSREGRDGAWANPCAAPTGYFACSELAEVIGEQFLNECARRIGQPGPVRQEARRAERSGRSPGVVPDAEAPEDARHDR